MKKVKIFIVLFVSGLFVNCASTNFGPTGFTFTSATIPVYAAKIESSKKATSCVHSLLGFVSWGGKSVPELAKESGMTTVNHITYETFSVLGIYAKLCSVVEGE